LEPHIISVNLQWKESTVNYNQFLKPKTVANAKAYLKTHCESLNAARERFGVSPQIIVAILTVETRLGTVTGTYPTINVLSTMAVADTPPVQERIFALLVPGETDAASREEVMRRLTARVGRGYRDLKAFLAYVRQQGKDPCIIKGSREGAIGIPQFIPSNITQYGHDGNNDGLIDLFDHDDAIASVARFLSLHRWNEDASVKEKKATLLRYNRSVYYVDAVYALARRLRRDKP
ncbi:MAG: lytic murein transglycosylase, partial [Deltaproteobacteria bacterium]|nr:lytic murein transglycosylase [Deltaproteobacteria bacterium]